eukprot:gene4733-5908_t
MLIYGVILAFGAKLISDGSEMLMEILDPKYFGIIGGLVLPFLSAFPDAAIIVVAGALGSDPQTQLNIGIGTLAGSTIMLLTIPWSASLLLARCDIRNGESVDGVCTSWSLTKTGVTVDEDTPLNAKIMVATSISYLIVQGVAFAYLKDPMSGQKTEKWFALAGFIVCFVLLVCYCTYQVISPQLTEKKIAEAKRQYLLKRTIHHFIHNLTKRPPPVIINQNTDTSKLPSPLVGEEHYKLPVDVKSMGLKWKNKSLKKKTSSSPTQSSPSSQSPPLSSANNNNNNNNNNTSINNNTDDQEIVEETSIPIEDEKKPLLAQKEEVGESSSSSDDEEEGGSKKKRALKAIGVLIVGAVLVAVFSDPMVDVITDFGTKINVNLFFVSFILTPFCSNASELISSLIFASKKRKQNTSLTYSALYGSATMNNTMCLGIFFALVFFKDLTWEFSAETLAILFVTICVGLIGSTHTTKKSYLAPLVLTLYPLSLVLVYLLETFAHWQ